MNKKARLLELISKVKNIVNGYFLVSVLSVFIVIWVLKLWQADLNIPLAPLDLDIIFNLMTIKSMVDTGWYLHNDFIGAPFGLDSHDLPVADVFHLVLIKLLTLFFDSATTLNLFFLSTFPLIATTSYFVFKRLNITNSISIVFSLVYTFLPYHFFRGLGHVFLAAYYMIPLITLIILSLWSNELPLIFINKNFKGRFGLNILTGKSILYIILCLIIGSTGVYYAFFSCFLLVVASVSAFLCKRDKRVFISASILIVLISSSVLVNVLPSLIFIFKYGDNPEVAYRLSGESEVFGLKIINLLLPVDSHRFSFFRELIEKYNRGKPPLQNENTSANLGVLGSLGFLSLIIRSIFNSVRIETKNAIPCIYDRLALLNLAAVLFATIGGFSSVFAVLLSPQIRGVNRFSIFIAFFSLLTVALFLDSLKKRYLNKTPEKIVFNSLLVIVLLFGIFDQTSPIFIHDYSKLKKDYLSDQSFVLAIEKVIPPGSMIFQLPYFPFPEYGRNVNKIVDYDLFRGYLHSKNLKWSYGAMVGRHSNWHQVISEEPLDILLAKISFVGFNGIYIDRYGYSDGGKNIELEIQNSLGVQPIVSGSQRLAFYSMELFNKELRNHYTSEEIENYKPFILNPIKIEWLKGFYEPESNPLASNNNLEQTWRWANKQGTLVINNPQSKPRQIKMSMSLQSGWPEYSNLRIESDLFSEVIKINNKVSVFGKTILLPPGEHEIKFSSDAKQIDAPQDERNLFFKILNFKIKEEMFENLKMEKLSPTQLEWKEGFYNTDWILGEKWRWSNKQGTLIINNPTSKVREAKLSMALLTDWSDYSNLKIESKLFSEVVKINNKESVFEKRIFLPPGKHEIKFSSDAKPANAPGDTRKLFFRINETRFFFR